jgi:hypothetical protein
LKWARSFGWQKKLQEYRNKEIANTTAAIDQGILLKKKQLAKILEKTIGDAAKKIKSGSLGIADQKELLSTIQAYLELIGEQTKPDTVIVLDFGTGQNRDKIVSHNGYYVNSSPKNCAISPRNSETAENEEDFIIDAEIEE